MVCARYAHAIFTVRKCVVYPNGMPAEDPCNNSEYLSLQKSTFVDENGTGIGVFFESGK